MKIGLIARADDRGLGTLTSEFHRRMRPTRTLIILTGDPNFPDHPDRYIYGDITSTRLGEHLSLNQRAVTEFLDGLDVVYSAETYYDWRVIEWARRLGVKTVLHGMPELTHHHRHNTLPEPDAWWWPTPWMLQGGLLKQGPVVPIPTTGRNNVAAHFNDEGPLRVVHPGGKEALGDRDGTKTMIECLRHIKQDIHLTIFAQDREIKLENVPSNVEVEVFGHVEDRWDMYRDQHVTVLPRRYGGLSLKVQESLDSGVPVVLPDIEPNRFWPGQRVRALRGRSVRVPYGQLPTWNTEPRALASEIDTLAAERSLLQVDQRQARDWATEHDWLSMARRYEREFEAVL